MVKIVVPEWKDPFLFIWSLILAFCIENLLKKIKKTFEKHRKKKHFSVFHKVHSNGYNIIQIHKFFSIKNLFRASKHTRKNHTTLHSNGQNQVPRNVFSLLARWTGITQKRPGRK